MKKGQSKRPMLVSVHFIVRVSHDEDEADRSVSDFAAALEDCGSRLLPNAAELEGWVASSSQYLDVDEVNAGRCARCETWCTDCESLDPVTGIGFGAVHHGKLLCDECLPLNHPRAFGSRIPKGPE